MKVQVMRLLVLCEGAAGTVVALEMLVESQAIYLDIVWAIGVLDELCVLRAVDRCPWAPS